MKRPSRTRNKNKNSPGVKRGLTISKAVRAGFGYITRTKLRYVSSFQLTYSGSAAGVRSFSANGLYDPDITGTGHQPMGFDTYASIYSKYIVRKSSLTILAVSPTDLANGAPTAMGILLSNASTLAYPGVDALMEQGLNPSVAMCNSSPLYRPVKLTSRTYKPEMFFNVVSPADVQVEIGALTGANPATQAYFNIWLGQTPSGSDIDPYNLTISITYEVEFFDLREIGQS